MIKFPIVLVAVAFAAMASAQSLTTKPATGVGDSIYLPGASTPNPSTDSLIGNSTATPKAASIAITPMPRNQRGPLPPKPVPEPASFCALAVGLVPILRRYQGKRRSR
jgi:hypothetical protein